MESKFEIILNTCGYNRWNEEMSIEQEQYESIYKKIGFEFDEDNSSVFLRYNKEFNLNINDIIVLKMHKYKIYSKLIDVDNNNIIYNIF